MIHDGDFWINVPLVVGIFCIYCISLCHVTLQTWMARSSRYRRYRLHPEGDDDLPILPRLKGTALIMLFLACLWAVLLTLGYDLFLRDGPAGLSAMAVQFFAILLIYDFLFYWTHRVLHRPFLMRFVHGMHHQIRVPMAIDDFFLHPGDATTMSVLFLSSVAIVGPVNTATFIAALAAWVFMNNSIHAGFHWPHPIFRLTNFWALTHDVHHGANRNANFGAFLPVWDMMFGTYHRVKEKPGSD